MSFRCHFPPHIYTVELLVCWYTCMYACSILLGMPLLYRAEILWTDKAGRNRFFFFFLEGREGARTHEWGMMHHGGNTILQVYNPVVWTFLSLRTRQRGSYPGPKNNSFTGMWRERDRGREEEEEKAPLWSTYTMHNAKASPLSCIA